MLQPKWKLLVIIESDQGALQREEREASKERILEVSGMRENEVPRMIRWKMVMMMIKMTHYPMSIM
ncbi:hypothetical protein OIU77_021054, partial [Salix suchowensis]